MTKEEKLLFSASKELIRQQSAKIRLIEKRLSRQNRIIREYEKIQKELEKECDEFHNIMKQVTREYNKQLKALEQRNTKQQEQPGVVNHINNGEK